MSAELDELALRKQLLTARAALQRLKITIEVDRMRDKSRWVGSVVRWAGLAFTVLRLLRRR